MAATGARGLKIPELQYFNRVVVDYTYPDFPAFGLNGGPGPEPTRAQLPRLKYDPEAKAVIYDGGGKRTIWASVRDSKFLFWKTTELHSTGSCTVVSQLADHTRDDGWSVRHSPVIDTYFEVR